jgi:hypothetical protein
LIAGQIAVTLLLLAGAGVAMRGFVGVMSVNLGYDPHNTMSVGIPVHDNTYTTWGARGTYFYQLLRKVSEVPEVVSAGLSTNATSAKQRMGTAIRDFRQAGSKRTASAYQPR